MKGMVCELAYTHVFALSRRDARSESDGALPDLHRLDSLPALAHMRKSRVAQRSLTSGRAVETLVPFEEIPRQLTDGVRNCASLDAPAGRDRLFLGETHMLCWHRGAG